MSKNMEDTGFKERLRGVMNVKEFQRKDLITLGFGGPRVDKWLAGHRKPRDRALRKIADWLEVSVDYLLGRRLDLEEQSFAGSRSAKALIRSCGKSASRFHRRFDHYWNGSLNLQRLPSQWTSGGHSTKTSSFLRFNLAIIRAKPCEGC